MLYPGDWVLRATLTQDLSHKYQRYMSDTVRYDSSPDLAPPNSWCVAGIYDFLSFAHFDELDQLANLPGQPSWADCRNLILFPFSGREPNEEYLHAIEKPDDKEASNFPLLVLAKVTLSAAAYEFGCSTEKRDSLEPLNTIKRLVELLEKTDTVRSLGDRLCFFGSLSSPELIILALPQTGDQWIITHELIQTARNLALAELYEGKFIPDGAKSGNAWYGDWPGHACASVTPVLGFRRAAHHHFSDPKFRSAERNNGLLIRSRLRVDCGHESQVVDDLRRLREDGIEIFLENEDSKCPAEDSTNSAQAKGLPATTNWTTYTIRIGLRHLADFVYVSKRYWFNRNWRALNLLDSVTVISLRNNRNGWKQAKPHWILSTEVRNSLDTIGLQIREFAQDFLNASQREELVAVYNTFRSCFFRQDLIGTACDLYPFFRELGAALAEKESWKEFFSPVSKSSNSTTDIGQIDAISRGAAVERADIFHSEFSRWVSDIHRAVRNRVEDRSVVGNPPFPQTLRYGTSKIISAYTVVSWICWNFFHLSASRTIKCGDASQFAACVCAGAQGRVECHEILPELRVLVEEKENTHLRYRKRDKWATQLLLLDIGGESLLRPEASFVHSLHEIAETSSEWLSSSRCEPVRNAINKWLLGECIQALCTAFRKRTGIAAEELQQFLGLLTIVSGSAMENGEQCGTYDEVKRRMNNWCKQFHPIDFIQELKIAIKSRVLEENLINGLIDLRPDIVAPAAVDDVLCRKIVTDREFDTSIEHIGNFATEVYADIGMWSAFRYLINPGESDLIDHLSSIFVSLLRAATESLGRRVSVRRLEQTLLRRWAIQAAAVMPTGGGWVEEILSAISNAGLKGIEVKEAEEYLVESQKFKVQLGTVKWSLVSRLKELEPYGGKKWNYDMAQAGGVSDVIDAFRDAWNQKSTSGRLAFIMSLWALSTRYSVDKLLVADYNG